MSGKGSRPRPFSISQEEFGERLEGIFGKKPAKEPYVPPPLPSNLEEKKTIDWGNSSVTDSETK